MTPDNKFGGSFGPNEWLVDEMYEQYLRDPNSIDEKWRAFFAGYKPGTNGANGSNGLAAGVPPVPKREQRTAPPTITNSEVKLESSNQVNAPINNVTINNVNSENQRNQPVVRQAKLSSPTPAQTIARPSKR